MSYCRHDGVESDVYVIATTQSVGGGGWWCCGCEKEGNFTKTRQGMVAHLQEHREAGDKVPQRAFDRLAKEIAAE
jgi:hypothetical protein